MSTSPNLQLPYIDANQNQKSVTHNAALTILDALINCQIQSAALSAPPGSPADGQRWIVASGATGAWTGKSGTIAAWQDGAWTFYAPRAGMLAYNAATGSATVWTGSAWSALSGGGGGGAVTSVAGRAGAVTLAVADVSGAAPLASPALTGAPTGPTQAAGDNTTKLATTAFVQGQGFATTAGAAAAAPVQSVAGRTGAVTLAVADVAGAAPLASPALTGTPSAPTPTAGDNSTKLATTAFVAASYLPASNAPALGIGTAADTGNPLSTKLNSALFTALPTASAGTGDVRVKLSKQAAGNTASFLFQDNFSGRAEIGLAGDDNVHFKVSADGSTWYDALDIAAASGTASFLNAPTAPTPTAGDNSTKLATTAFVQGQGFVTSTGAAAAAPVQSIAGRTGAVTLAVADVSGAAPLASPAFSGTPTAPNLSAGDTSSKIPNANFVTAAIAAVTARRQVSDAAATIAASDRTVAVTALTAARTLTLPAASAYPGGATLTLVDESGACSATNSLTIAAAGTDTINGSGSAVLSTPYSYLALGSNTSNKWTVIDQAIVSPLPWANGGTGDTGTAWTAYTPTVAPTSGALTAYSASGRYKKLGRTVLVQFTIAITTNGSAGGGLNVSLPFAAAGFNYTLAGRENGVSGKSLVSVVTASAANCFVANYDATYPGASGASITLSGVYESAS